MDVRGGRLGDFDGGTSGRAKVVLCGVDAGEGEARCTM